MNKSSPIGIFDSGVGGLSVFKAIQELLPHESQIYIGDQIHIPYGLRPLNEIHAYATAVTRFLLSKGVKMIVVACNTASAAALTHLRTAFPQISFVGMEPAVKPAAEHSTTKHVGVLATPATFQGRLYASVVERFAQDVVIHQSTVPYLVEEIEAGRLRGRKTRSILNAALRPMMSANIDSVVLGCTHFPFVIPLIREIVGDKVNVIDPSPAIARRVESLLKEKDLLADVKHDREPQFYTTGDPVQFSRFAKKVIEDDIPVSKLTWEKGVLVEKS